MFTVKSILAGSGSVILLFVAICIYRTFSRVSTTSTSGPAVLVSDLFGTLTSFAFWLAAVLLFLVVVFFVARHASPACLVICCESAHSAIISEAIHHRSTEDTELLF
jgi:hypothetical protein